VTNNHPTTTKKEFNTTSQEWEQTSLQEGNDYPQPPG